jgi:hypothetical protein
MTGKLRAATAVIAGAISLTGATTNATALPDFAYNAKGRSVVLAGVPGTELETVGGKKVVCNGPEATGGKFAAPSPTPKIEKMRFEFVGCVLGAEKCTSAGEPAGTIVFGGIAGEAGYLNKLAIPKEVGLLLKPEGAEWGKFECGAKGESKLKGSFIGRFVTPKLNKPTFICEGFAVQWKQLVGVQEIASFEGGAANSLMLALNGAGVFEVAGFESGAFLQGTEPGREIELRA